MAKPPEPASADSVVFNQFSGIKNTVNRERLAPTELEVALNVDIDDVGQLRRRRGYTLRSAGNFHSVWTAADGTLYGSKNGLLGIIYPNYTFQSLAFSSGDAPIAFCQVGDTIYFSSEDVSGKINHPAKTVSAWGAVASDNTWLSPVVNPTSTLAPLKGRLLGKPPMATALTYYNGRIYLANGRTVWATELYLYDYVEKVKNYMMYESDITALGTVTDGIYVGTEDGLYFQTGPFSEMRRIPVSGGVLPGSMIPVDSGALPDNMTNNSRAALMYVSDEGIHAALDGGLTINLTQNRVVFPQAIRVNSLFRQQDGVNQFVSVADNAGTPSSNARIGDYVDAEIRRFQGA